MNLNLKFLKQKKNFQRKHFQLDADFYWKIVLAASFFIVLFFFVFGAYLFIQINKDFSSSDTVDVTQTNSISKDRINKDLQFFSDRQTESTNILNSPSPISDPSL